MLSNIATTQNSGTGSDKEQIFHKIEVDLFTKTKFHPI